MSLPDPQQSEPQTDAMGEPPAPVPSADQVARDLSEVDALLDQVEGLATNIVEDVDELNGESPVALDAENLTGPDESETSDVALEQAEQATEPAQDIELSDDLPTELPQVLELDESADIEDADSGSVGNAVCADDESQAILDSLQALDEDMEQSTEENTTDDSIDDVENTLVLAEEDSNDSDAAGETEFDQGDSGPMAEVPSGPESVEGEDNAVVDSRESAVAVDTDTDMADLLHDPDNDVEANPEVADSGSDAIDSDQAAAVEVGRELAPDEKVAPNINDRRRRRLFRVARVARRRAWRKIRNPKKLLTGVFSTPKKVTGAVQSMLVWMDRPFARVSIGKKNFFGVVAVATLIAGVLLWTLPYVLYSNPYDGMTKEIASVR